MKHIQDRRPTVVGSMTKFWPNLVKMIRIGFQIYCACSLEKGELPQDRFYEPKN